MKYKTKVTNKGIEPDIDRKLLNLNKSKIVKHPAKQKT
jgi:hypothetical protein